MQQITLKTIAIVGRPNVGKSSLFNALIGKRKSITERTAGTTRDRVYEKLVWKDRAFQLADTGGLIIGSHDKMAQLVKKEVARAIEEAEALVFACDGKSGLTALDEEMATLIRKSGKPAVLVITKTDDEGVKERSSDFYKLGFEDLFFTSAFQRKGLKELLDKLADFIPKREAVALPCGEATSHEEKAPIRVAIVGRPNVGKSSFYNAILGEERVIVDSMPGTTRDAIDTHIEKDGVSYIFVDTAGFRHKKKMKDTIEIFSFTRSRANIKKSHICLLILNAEEGVGMDDVKVADMIKGEGKGCIICLNKWDLVKEASWAEYEKQLRWKLRFMDYAPAIFTSAITGRGVNKALELIKVIKDSISKRINEQELQNFIKGVTCLPRVHFGRRPHLRSLIQIGIEPPSFELRCDIPQALDAQYLNYVENEMRKSFGFFGTPIVIKVRR